MYVPRSTNQKGLILNCVSYTALASAISIFSSVQADAQAIASDGTTVETVIVSAEKRDENILTVPVPVTAISGDRLVDQGKSSLTDYFSDFPGLTFGTGDRNDVFPSIRGLGTGPYANSTVAAVIDDVPYGATIGQLPAPDINPSDLDRIEVLRGPQGTLYGASSVGGLIKYVTKKPTTDGFSGELSAGFSSVTNGAELGYSVRGAANIPLTDDLAMRVSAFTKLEPGYIDNPVLNLSGVNVSTETGAHISVRWAPTSDFSLTLASLVQGSGANGNNNVFGTPGFTGLQQNYLPNSGGYNRLDESTGATMVAKLWGIDVTSITGYSYYSHTNRADLSAILGGFASFVFGPSFSGLVLNDTQTVHKLSQEVHFSSSLGDRIDWLAGLYYTHEAFREKSNYAAVNSKTFSTADFGTALSPANYTEYAAFADLTLHVTDHFDIQIGGRQSIDKQSANNSRSTAFQVAPATPVVTPSPAAKESPGTYLFTPQYKFSDQLMTYVRIASGFQPGGPNSTGPNVPPTFKPNTAVNYELGAKGVLFDGILTYDGSLYHIDWRNLPTLVFDPSLGQSYRTNLGEAISDGAELSAHLKPWQGGLIGGWIALGNAHLAQDLPAGSTLYGKQGDRLPYSTRLSANLSAEQSFPILEGWNGYVGAQMSYIGDRIGSFQKTAVRQVFPAYEKFDVRMGVTWNSWSANFNINNIGDRRGAIGGGLDAFFAPYPLIYITPRTFEFNLTREF